MEEARVLPNKTIENLESKHDNGEDLMSTFATAEIPPDVSDTPQHETQMNDHENAMAEQSESSTSSSRRQSEAEGFLQIEQDGQPGAKSASSRSSLSSIPDSVLIHSKERSGYGRDSMGGVYEEQEEESCSYGNPVYQKIRDPNSPFRHPSSVKAIQMQTEDEEDDGIMSPSRRKAAMFRGSPTSVRSMGSPLLRRHGYHSAGNTPRRSSPIKRENPLVLLHCTVLQPTVVLGPGISQPDRQILEKVLPPQYARRWKLLEEKILCSGLLRDRGLLIQHPQEDYGLLEERLLESLELQKPRLENGHYNNHEASDSENENEEALEHMDSKDQAACVDCGCRITRGGDRKKWDVKVFAANGLMKEGAWTAAWKEIERVDVQISLWLPYDVKSEVEKKIHEETLVAAELKKMKAAELIGNEIQPNPEKIISQDEIDGLDDGLKIEKSPPNQETLATKREIPAYERPRTNRRKAEPELHTLIINSIRVLASDKRNIITVISMLIAVLAVVFGGRQSRRSEHGYDMTPYGNFPAVSTQVYHTTSTSVLTQSSTEVPIRENESRVERASEVQRVVERVLAEVNHQPYERRQKLETVIEPVEHGTIEIVVERKAEATEKASAGDNIVSSAIIEPTAKVDRPVVPNDGNIEGQEPAVATEEDVAPSTTQINVSVTTEPETPIPTNDEKEATAQTDELAASQEQASAATQVDHDSTKHTTEAAVTQNAESVLTRENDSTVSQIDDATPSQVENSVFTPQANESTAAEVIEITTTQGELPIITENGDLGPQDDTVPSQDEDEYSDHQIEEDLST